MQVGAGVPLLVKLIASEELVVGPPVVVIETVGAVPCSNVTESVAAEPKPLLHVTVMTLVPEVRATGSPEVIELLDPPLLSTVQVGAGVPPLVKLIASEELVVFPPTVLIATDGAVPTLKLTTAEFGP